VLAGDSMLRLVSTLGGFRETDRFEKILTGVLVALAYTSSTRVLEYATDISIDGRVARSSNPGKDARESCIRSRFMGSQLRAPAPLLSLPVLASWTCWLTVATFMVLASLLMLVRMRKRGASGHRRTLAFFHPFAECGGGGERVLWAAVDALVREGNGTPEYDIVIYCQDVRTSEKSSEQVLADHANSRFNLAVPPSAFRVVPIRYRHLLVPSNYPRLTMVFQALASIVVTVECLWRGGSLPDVWVDTTGWAFGYPLLKLLDPRMSVVAYVHYPTVSSDMLMRVKNREASYNNRARVTRSRLLSLVKALYYQMVGYWYGFCGGCADVCMVNSSWTKAHVEEIFWWRGRRRPRGRGATLVYPPCDCVALSSVALEGRRGRDGTKQIISLAQFRPEKNHEVQLEAVRVLAEMRETGGDTGDFKVAFVGGCRDAGDFARVERLRSQTKALGLEDRVAFFVNVPFPELQRLLGASVAGLHSMKDEHFGISVVEYMAAGAIPIAHNSAGPRMDIVTKETGYLVETAEECAAAMAAVLGMSESDRVAMAALGRRRAELFTQEKFQQGFLGALLSGL